MDTFEALNREDALRLTAELAFALPPGGHTPTPRERRLVALYLRYPALARRLDRGEQNAWGVALARAAERRYGARGRRVALRVLRAARRVVVHLGDFRRFRPRERRGTSRRGPPKSDPDPDPPPPPRARRRPRAAA
jgi:hypothetical protein